MEHQIGVREFKIFGNSIEDIAIKYGIFLIIWGGLISYLSQSQSFTSWIPGIIGLPIFVLGWISKKIPSTRKIAMHFVVVIGFLAFLSGLDFFRSGFSNLFAGSSKLMLLLTGLLFCYICIRSFIFVREEKKNTENRET
jgi:hypothetical protein